MVTKKTTTPKVSKPAKAGKPVVKKPRAVHKPADKAETKPTAVKPHAAPKGRYIFATGRRKTAIANVRLFTGSGSNVVNKKTMEKYFSVSIYREEALQPFQLTGLHNDYYFVAHINGGGAHAQAQALRHGLAQTLGKTNEDVRKILKKNSLLTRDDRKKERKKPGLKRARRSPQWAKR